MRCCEDRRWKTKDVLLVVCRLVGGGRGFI